MCNFARQTVEVMKESVRHILLDYIGTRPTMTRRLHKANAGPDSWSTSADVTGEMRLQSIKLQTCEKCADTITTIPSRTVSIVVGRFSTNHTHV
jgi:hypothetical protein